MTNVFINEFHYDNIGGDQNEFVEIAKPVGVDVSGWTIELYNGTATNRRVYETVAVPDESAFGNPSGGYHFGVIALPPNGLQNGGPDGIALVDGNGDVVEFLSYEGSFVAADGAAEGLTSVDVGVAEDGDTPVGHSLQRFGTGDSDDDFTWATPGEATPGEVNTDQAFAPEPATVGIGQSFELEEPGAQYTDTGDASVDHDLVNNPGESPVDSTAASAGTLGFDASYVNTRGDVGLTDGDFVGVTSFTGDVGAFTDGSQGYELQDSDGLMRVTFDAIDLSGVGATDVSIDYFVTETGWESDDVVRIYVETDIGTYDILDSTGSDIDDLGIEGEWTTGSVQVAAAAGFAQLIVELDSNAATEALYIDNIQISSDPALAPLISEFQPNPPGADPAEQTVELSGTPGEVFDGWLLSIEGDAGAPIGTVDRATQITGTFGSDGLLTAAVSDLENPTFTLVLVDSFTGTTGTDIDLDDDGTPDELSSFGTVLDAIGIPDSAGDEGTLYGAALGGTDFSHTGEEPEIVFRAGSRGDLFAVNVIGEDGVYDTSGSQVPAESFDSDPTDGTTFDAVNPALLPPAATELAIAAADADREEGDSGATTFTFTVTRSGDLSGETSVAYTVTGGTADAGDFVSTAGGIVTFAADETTATIEVFVSGDTAAEDDETFTVTLSDPSPGAAITTATAEGVIRDDDTEVEITAIHDIQGAGFASPLEGTTVTIRAVVVGDYQSGGLGSDGDLGGFFVQEEDGDADGLASTSEGLFIFDDSFGVNVEVNDVVEITGTVVEFNGLTELTEISDVMIVGQGAPLPTPATLNMPVATVEEFEAVEGMLVTIPDTLYVTEYFNLDRFGEVVVSSDGPSNQPGTDPRLDQYTQFNDPDVAGFAEYQDAIERRSLTIDDGLDVQNPEAITHARGDGPLSVDNILRGGDTVTGLTGILSEGFGDYRIQPTDRVDFEAGTERPVEPEDVGGSMTVATFNVLNFFTTIDGSGFMSGPDQTEEPRGADSGEEYQRQLDKLVSALSNIGADVYGLIELENEFGGDQNGDGQYAINALVEALNTATGQNYAVVEPGVAYVGGDAIANGFIYNADTVGLAPGTSVAILDDSDLDGLGLEFDHPVFNGEGTNRPVVAASFQEIATGGVFTAAVNHFKSKGSPGTFDDPDQLDGQGNANLTRLAAAEALDAWLATDPTGAEDDDHLILGDLNSYAREDPITFLESQGFTDLVELYEGEDAYGYVFDGQYGTLDYAMASEDMLGEVTGATVYQINSDEPDAFDYNLDFDRDPALFDPDSPYRSSDHDPVIVGLNLEEDRAPTFNVVVQEEGDRAVAGTDEADLIEISGGRGVIIDAMGGADAFDFGAIVNDGNRDYVAVAGFEEGETIAGFGQDDIAMSRGAGNALQLLLAGDNDIIVLNGIDGLEDINFVDELAIA